MRVLIVDDSRAMRMLVRRALAQTGLDIESVEAEDGQQGLKMLQECAPDLVLSDWNMPNMTGVDFLRAARVAGYRGKFVLVTTEWVPEAREEAMEAGATTLIAKPFTAEQLALVVEETT